VSRLLEALRQLQQPETPSSSAAPQRKVTPRLAASIRKAVLGREAAVDAPVLFRVPDAESAQQPAPPPAGPLPEILAIKTIAGDPVKLVETIAASIHAVQNEPTQKPSEAAKLPPTGQTEAKPAPPRPQPTPGEAELASLLNSGPQAASFRELLAAVERDTAGKQRPVVAIVGLDEQDSTGLVAAALATLLGEKESTLLVEAHPHGRDIARRFGLSETIGLCESLSGRAAGDHNIAPTSEQRLGVLAFGRATSSQAQLLPPALPALMSQLRSRFGRTVIDAGPLLGAWAAAASQTADAVYLLVRLGNASAEHAVSCVQRFRASGGKLTGCVALGGQS
jgi:Mrp family chromosome partitioning ATPase